MIKQERTTVAQAGKKIWISPWSYPESFIIAFTLIVLGFIVELFFKEHQVPVLHRPYNLIILFSGIAFLTLLHVFYRKTAFLRWFSSIPCAISAILSYVLLVLLLGFIKQEDASQPQWMQVLGLNQIKNSWPFLFIELYLFVSLGLVILRRSYPSRKNIGFLLNHLGLWITFIAAAMGSGDLQRLRIGVFEKGDFISKGIATDHQVYSLPFSIKLLDFTMENYNPKMMLSDSTGGLPRIQKAESLPVIEKGTQYRLDNYSINILSILPYAARTDNGYEPSSDPMAATAAKVHVKNMISGDTVTNWICSGSTVMLPEYILLEENLGLWLLRPEPKKFESVVVVKTSFGEQDTVTIEVNKPYKTRGWSFYQVDYEEKLGPASKLSIIEAVYDPWIKVVYTGIALMLAGAGYLFWLGRGVKGDE